MCDCRLEVRGFDLWKIDAGIVFRYVRDEGGTASQGPCIRNLPLNHVRQYLYDLSGLRA